MRLPAFVRGMILAPALLWPAPAALQAADAGPKPNIVLIMADDLGYECLSANGSNTYKTPRLDRLAKGGMRFLHCHSQLCSYCLRLPKEGQEPVGRRTGQNFKTPLLLKTPERPDQIPIIALSKEMVRAGKSLLIHPGRPVRPLIAERRGRHLVHHV